MISRDRTSIRSELLSGTFRANPNYELVVADRLSPDEQRALRSLGEEPDFYGLLRSPDAKLTLKSVDRDAALLFLTLRVPSTIPRYVSRLVGDKAAAIIATLVLEGVLEIEWEGAFRSGPTAAEALFIGGEPHDPNAATSLTDAALRYGHGLRLADPIELSARLYRFNTEPNRLWRDRRTNPAAIEASLGIDTGSLCDVLSPNWERHDSGRGEWAFWSRRQSSPRRGLPLYKLYVSVRVADLANALLCVGKALSSFEAIAQKVARTPLGILRPDKHVIYFESWDELRTAAHRLDEDLRAFSPQGVPFAAPLGHGGRLFWGMDPPRRGDLPPWIGVSWRKWVTDLVGATLVNCTGNSFGNAIRVVKQRCRLAGVDPLSWSPIGGGLTKWKNAHGG